MSDFRQEYTTAEKKIVEAALHTVYSVMVKSILYESNLDINQPVNYQFIEKVKELSLNTPILKNPNIDWETLYDSFDSSKKIAVLLVELVSISEKLHEIKKYMVR